MPYKEGYGKYQKFDLNDAQQRKYLKISEAATLADLAKDGYTFFTHAVMQTHLGYDPLWMIINRSESKIDPIMIQASERIFKNLGEFWSFVILAVELAEWEVISRELDRYAMVDRTNRKYATALKQRLPLVDFLALKKTTLLPVPVPTVDIFFYGIDGNKVCIHAKPALNPPIDSIQIVIDPPCQETVVLAESILSEARKPFDAIDPVRGGFDASSSTAAPKIGS